MDEETSNEDPRATADSKKKKSTFRITSIIDPVNPDKNVEEEEKPEEVGEIEEKATASRFRVINSETPNPRTFYSGRWKVKEMYLLELTTSHKETASGTSLTSNESTGDCVRCPTPLSPRSSGDNDVDGVSKTSHSAAKLDTSQLESYEPEITKHFQENRERLNSLHTLTTTINQKYEKLKKEHEKMKTAYEKLQEENSKKDDLIKSLKEDIKRLNSR